MLGHVLYGCEGDITCYSKPVSRFKFLTAICYLDVENGGWSGDGCGAVEQYTGVMFVTCVFQRRLKVASLERKWELLLNRVSLFHMADPKLSNLIYIHIWYIYFKHSL